MDEELMMDIHDGYGNPKSVMLKEIREKGFKPIGITVMLCEETFIFKGKKDAERAWEIFKPEGWWYGIGDFIDARKQYLKDMHCDSEDDAPTVYWFDKNYEPR